MTILGKKSVSQGEVKNGNVEFSFFTKLLIAAVGSGHLVKPNSDRSNRCCELRLSNSRADCTGRKSVSQGEVKNGNGLSQISLNPINEFIDVVRFWKVKVCA